MDTLLRIGALAERTGVSTHVLRIWQERYGLVSPQRSAGGYRLYDTDDERRVLEMVALRGRGVSAVDAAAIVLAGHSGGGTSLEDLVVDLGEAFARYDEAAAQAVIDGALARNDALDVVDRLFFPCLRRLGDDWETGTVSVAQEHFGSGLIRGRMLALATRYQPAVAAAPVAVLACPTHERHDIGLLALCLLLRRDGWSVTFLGADTPLPSVVGTAIRLDARLVVLAGTEPHMFAAQLAQYADDLGRLPESTTLALGGRAAARSLAEAQRAVHLAGDPGAAAAGLLGLLGRVPFRSGA